MRDTELGWRFVSPPFYKKGGRSENSFALRIWGYGIRIFGASRFQKISNLACFLFYIDKLQCFGFRRKNVGDSNAIFMPFCARQESSTRLLLLLSLGITADDESPIFCPF